jgi:hypothetical protein
VLSFAISLVASDDGIDAIYMADGARLGSARQAAAARVGPELRCSLSQCC